MLHFYPLTEIEIEAEDSNEREKERAPMRIPESLRAIGTDGFRISSL